MVWLDGVEVVWLDGVGGPVSLTRSWLGLTGHVTWLFGGTSYDLDVSTFHTPPGRKDKNINAM